MGRLASAWGRGSGFDQCNCGHISQVYTNVNMHQLVNLKYRFTTNHTSKDLWQGEGSADNPQTE